MGPFSMIVAIVFIVMVATVLKARYRALGPQQNQQAQSAEAIRMAEDVRQLKERIAVLERVVTDNHGSLGLDREIERLRDR